MDARPPLPPFDFNDPPPDFNVPDVLVMFRLRAPLASTLTLGGGVAVFISDNQFRSGLDVLIFPTALYAELGRVTHYLSHILIV